MKRLFTGLTDPGLLRAVNQDDYFIDPKGRFFIVADGMGGHAGGQEASRIATQAIQTYLNEHWDSDESSQLLLENAFLKANVEILQDQSKHPERADMGTTAVAVMFRDDQPWCAHIGDSRLYRLRGAKLHQITEDHTWVARAMKSGDLTPDQARIHPWRHILSKCLGREDVRQVDVQPFDLQPNDRLLLCSDGLTEELSDQLIASHLKTIRACDRAALALVNAAKERGGRDNITVVIVAFDDSNSYEE
ncbi:Stp1/IreP family PP2C-type Ser/Thr phosphatase [Leptolyngbya sp. NK1-12]|uniref:Stp1/IreP family PP2C-type Ser/Thr phosphatase n=1 Tax=Leptolyngbya sp. NK1-12 TaxID=2547451 RepID=A0AA97AF71_9CYAN|nr:Stp1/IreP family PP2C-type Ser/Thr phosphatase [Leptolyngbya sp. NK1-12]WNZ22845.1 Stp1/IreP family PP2C-type Ser/Thr phosphatase [Leptolyngbya sp. NK1-12]